MIAADTIRTAFPTSTDITITKNNGNVVTGTLYKITAKSVTVTNVDATNTHIPLAHIDTVTRTVVDDVMAGGDDDVLTTAELAAIFDTNAKALRVELRRLGLGVGKGRRYGLTRADVRPHADAIRTGLAERAAS